MGQANEAMKREELKTLHIVAVAVLVRKFQVYEDPAFTGVIITCIIFKLYILTHLNYTSTTKLSKLVNLLYFIAKILHPCPKIISNQFSHFEYKYILMQNLIFHKFISI
ncbi:hypothetical protein ACJX0J_021469 [Zea mays]